MLILSPFTCTTALYTLSLHDALPICRSPVLPDLEVRRLSSIVRLVVATLALAHLALLAVLLSEVEEVRGRSEEHTSELQSRGHLVCRLLPEKKLVIV